MMNGSKKITPIMSRLFRWMVRPTLPGIAFVVLGLFPAGCQSASSKPEVQATTISPAATLPTLFVAGDSTVHNTGPGLAGWGDVIGRFFDPAKISVTNFARGGRSSRTFQTEGWWAQILADAKPGDFVLIQFGHNDGGPLDDTNRARGSIPGLGGESKEIYNPIMKKPEVVHTYGWYMRKYIADARAKGMTPIICSPVPRVPQQPPQASDVDRYAVWSAQTASDQKVFFINLNHIILSHYAGFTTNEIKTMFYTTHDNTHFSPAGAELNAACVIEGLRELKNCPLKDYILDQSKPLPPK
ncbi:MAG: rhamnogalacturonan acetylesterase [Limisphaerales bacterium]